MTPITPELVEAHGLSGAEFEAIAASLGRSPDLVELGLFSAMWSEHCSYKSSRTDLARLPTRSDRVVQGPGENAGVVRVEDGLEVAFKIESHNHPSFVEPYQGAATGVGGILRDIIVMGARPVAILDSLHFGPPGDRRNRHILEGVVAGIAGYGNCVGVPTVGGQVTFSESFAKNPLVNVMAVGVVGPAGVFRSAAGGPGNLVLVFGSPTGRDGVRGASFASRDLGPDSMKDRPAVQIGDPFTGKRLLEACQELFAARGVAGIQDMGAAGLTCASSEMAARGGVGMVLDLDRVPVREAGLSAYDLMLSETQERMMVVIEPGALDAVTRILDRWQLPWAVAGEVTAGGRVVLTRSGEPAGDVPARALTDGCPPAHRVARFARYLEDVHRPREVPRETRDLDELTIDFLAGPALRSRRPIFEQYDSMVGTDTVLGPGAADAALLRVKGHESWLAATTDCNPRFCYLEPQLGAMHAVAEAARNLACVGAEPLGLTDGLNFASPADPEVFYQFSQSITGLARACEALGIPVVGGNVSFYNQTGSSRIEPTPVVGMLGVVPATDRPVGMGFRDPGDRVYLVGRQASTLAGSEYLAWRFGLVFGPPPALDLAFEGRIHRVIRRLVVSGVARSAHDLSEGGLMAALAECCLTGGPAGFCGSLPAGADPILNLFAEDPSRVLISVVRDQAKDLEATLDEAGLPWFLLGRVDPAPRLVLEGLLNVELARLRSAWEVGFDE